jgi:hypothetical protein
MKKTIYCLIFLFTITIGYSQLASGKYQIKLVFSQKVLELYSNSFVLNPSCENPLAAACKKQIWDIKSVAGRVGVYTITNAENNQLLSHSTENEGRGFSMNLRLLPIKPQAQREEQYFNIIEKRNSDGTIAGYVIQPYSRSNPTVAKEYYFGARASSMRWDNCPLELFFNNGADTEKISYESLLFSLNKVSGGVIIQPSRVLNDGVVVAPTVVVAPKSDNKIDIDFKTGGDNLEVKSFQENLEIRIIVQNKPDVILLDANKNQNWPNNSIRRVSISLPIDVTADEIKEIHLYRKHRNNIKYVWELGEKDNWNLETINAVATIVTDGVKKKFEFEKMTSVVYGKPLYRFTYDSNNNDTEGNFCKRILNLKSNVLPPAVNANVPVQIAKLELNIGTGGDDLRGGNDNCNVVFTFNSNPRKIQLSNVFNRRPLGGFTEKSITKDIPNSQTLDINDIKTVEIHHTGGGGIGADNWDIDKVKITIIKDGQVKILVDRVGAPLHRFDGDNRIKRFNVE